MRHWLLFSFSVVVLFGSGFLYKEVGPLIYGLISLLTLSAPLLLKLGFWKKVIALLPLLLLRVIGKNLLFFFGRNAFTVIMRRYGLIERRWSNMIEAISDYRVSLITTWRGFPPTKQAYLILIFLPIALAIGAIILLLEIIRLKAVQLAFEKILGRGFAWVSDKLKRDQKSP